MILPTTIVASKLAPLLLSPLSLSLPSTSLAIKSNLAMGLTVRGGGAAAVGLTDFASEAAAYFDGIRGPASLIVGASLGALFTDITSPTSMKTKNPTQRLCIRAYNACVLLSFMLSLCTIISATAAGVTILHGEFDPLADTAYNLLNKEFTFEFLTVRLSYLASLLTFMIGVTCRALLEYELLKDPNNKDAALTIGLGMGSLVTFLLSYINSTLHESQSLVGMVGQLFHIIFTRAVTQHQPLQIISLGLFASTAFFFGRVLKNLIKAEEKLSKRDE